MSNNNEIGRQNLEPIIREAASISCEIFKDGKSVSTTRLFAVTYTPPNTVSVETLGPLQPGTELVILTQLPPRAVIFTRARVECSRLTRPGGQLYDSSLIISDHQEVIAPQIQRGGDPSRIYR